MNKIDIEVGKCDTCDKEPVCDIKGRKQDIVKVLESIKDLNEVDGAFTVTLSCEFYRRVVIERGY